MAGDNEGHSEAASIFVAAVFFVLFLSNMAQGLYSKYLTYDFVVCSCLFRAVGFVMYTCWIVTGSVQYLGAFQGLTTAGFGASVACTYILLATWCRHTEVELWPVSNRILTRLNFSLLVPSLLSGPGCGALGSVLSYGGFGPKWEAIGFRLRLAGGWTIFALSLVTLIHIAYALCCVVHIQPSTHNDGRAKTKDNSRVFKVIVGRTLSGEWLVVVLMVSIGLAMISATARVVTFYQKYMQDDVYYYPLIILPELLATILLTAPGILARVGTAGEYPPSEEEVVSKRSSSSSKGETANMIA